MGETTEISWTDHSFNPWWGCVKVSPGCRFCYANSLSSRYGHDVWGKKKPRRMFGDKHWAEPLKWNAESEHDATTGEGLGRRHRVFCASMADVFEDHPALPEPRERLWRLVADTPWLDWQLLTKRPENIAGMVPWGEDWPANVWLGTSVEDQRRGDQRIPLLLGVGAQVHFLSVEPLLGPVTLAQWLPIATRGAGYEKVAHRAAYGDPRPYIGWTIIGGESGAQARRMNIEWVRRLVEQCRVAEVPAFVKQMGTSWARGHRDEFTHPDLRSDYKGGNWEAWPEDLRVREFPAPLVPVA
jgi:protein gp37